MRLGNRARERALDREDAERYVAVQHRVDDVDERVERLQLRRREELLGGRGAVRGGASCIANSRRGLGCRVHGSSPLVEVSSGGVGRRAG